LEGYDPVALQALASCRCIAAASSNSQGSAAQDMAPTSTHRGGASLTLKTGKSELVENDADVDMTTSDQSSDGTQVPPTSNAGRSSNDSEEGYSNKASKDGSNGSGSGRDEVSSDETPKRATDAQPAGASPPQYQTLKRNGPMKSKGSDLHDEGGCKPCAFYCYSKNGCSKEAACGYCHLFHESKSLVKRGEHKKQTTRQKGLRENSSKDVTHNVSRQHSRQQTMDTLPEVVPMKVESSSQAAPMLTGEMQGQNIAVGSRNITSLSGMVDGAGEVGAQLFSYVPGTVMAAVGQPVKLWPVVNGSNTAGRIYAVAPDLPQGLTIDSFTGVIHGVPQQATDGTGVHFVTYCDPLAHYGVNTAVVHITVMNIHTAAFESANPMQQVPPATGSLAYEDMFTMFNSMLRRQPSINHAADFRESVEQQLSAQLAAQTSGLMQILHYPAGPQQSSKTDQ
jgi:hypothetical protein